MWASADDKKKRSSPWCTFVQSDARLNFFGSKFGNLAVTLEYGPMLMININNLNYRLQCWSC